MNGIVEFAGGKEWGLVVSSPHVSSFIWREEGVENDTQCHFTLLYGPRCSDMIHEDTKDIWVLFRVKPQTRNLFYHLHIQFSTILNHEYKNARKQEKINFQAHSMNASISFWFHKGAIISH